MEASMSAKIITKDYPKNGWQQVQIDYDMNNDQYDVYSAPEGEELQLLGENLPIRSQNQRHLDFITLSSFDYGTEEIYYDNFSLEYISTISGISISGANGVYQQDFDAALGADGASKQALPTGWSGSPNSVAGYETSTTRNFPASSTPRATLLYGAGADADPDRALAIGVSSTTESGTLQLLADVTDASANSLEVAFDLEAWDAGTNTSTANPGIAAFNVTVDIDSGDGFVPLVDLGRVATGELQTPDTTYLNGNDPANRVSFDSGLLSADIPVGSQLRLRWTVADAEQSKGWVFGVDNFSLSLLGGLAELAGDFNGDGALGIDDLNTLTAAIQDHLLDQAYDLDGSGVVDLADQQYWVTDLKHTWIGDANLDGVFDTGDLTSVFASGHYEDAIVGNSTWSTGDWNGDGDFDSGDLIAAFSDGGYEAGPRAAVAAVPEPSTLLLGLVLAPFAASLLRNKRRGN